jgi:hypothetical protein
VGKAWNPFQKKEAETFLLGFSMAVISACSKD